MDRKEAIKVIRDYYPSSGKDLNEALETLIPELKESEDEKIRKQLIKETKGSEIRLFEIVTNDEFVAWLEKQGNKEEINEASYRTGIKRVLDNPESYGLEKQGPQELANSAKTCKIEPKFKVGDTIHEIGERHFFPMVIEKIEDGDYVCDNGSSFINIEFQDKYELVEQNSAWSEEDKEALRVVTNIFEQYGVKLLCYPAFVHWLKTLPDSITFNPYWKPSDEQMEALDDFIYAKYPNTEKHGAAVKSLYQDLKKLKR